MSAQYSQHNPGPRMTTIKPWMNGYVVMVHQLRGGLMPDLISVRYVSFNDITIQ